MAGVCDPVNRFRCRQKSGFLITSLPAVKDKRYKLRISKRKNKNREIKALRSRSWFVVLRSSFLVIAPRAKKKEVQRTENKERKKWF